MMLDARLLINQRKTLTALPEALLPDTSLLSITLLGFGRLLLPPLSLSIHPVTQIKGKFSLFYS